MPTDQHNTSFEQQYILPVAMSSKSRKATSKYFSNNFFLLQIVLALIINSKINIFPRNAYLMFYKIHVY